MSLRSFPGDEANEVLPGLFIGSKAAAEDKAALQSNGITHVLTTTGMAPPFPDDFEYLVINLADGGCPITDDLPGCLEFVSKAREGGSGGVLVHCGGGSGRSGAVTIAAVMKEKGLSADDALSFVQQYRSKVSPPEPFMEQLRAGNF
eukprot:TRINITY_DN1994_c0_g1_i1.p1 TRINITY_DN1994_c0_g1~~TRINITY_DN1994_c0_g1_i1.p1  ORF type:complete len:147 (+),score=43.32 TRINITY_DN1994_c0_g1_i1:263-703(+)